jgi:cellulose synthase/poly-beta-1,6-N-acetylglucosamine synthase-like glycosyltransferase
MGVVMLVTAVAIAGYAYLGYPVLLWALGWRRRAAPARAGDWPNVTITLPVHNEEHVVADTLEAILTLDYPPDRMRVVVVSDCSTDRTDEIVGDFAARGVKLVRLPRRAGKTAAENEARHHLEGAEIVVNTDASVRPARGALKALVAAFVDPKVGIASGRDVSVARPGADANIGESGYVGYEMWIRDLETRAGGIVGASGCFFASRPELHREIVPEALSRDFAAPLIARERGFRSVSVKEAVCFVPRAPSLRREYRRKVRTMTRGLETLYYKRHLLNPLRYGRFGWMLMSHKLVRWLVPWAVVLGGVALAVLAPRSAWARWLLVVGAVPGAAAGLGWMWPDGRKMPRILALPTYFVWSVVAGLVAWVKALQGDLNPIWEPTRRGTTPER